MYLFLSGHSCLSCSRVFVGALRRTKNVDFELFTPGHAKDESTCTSSLSKSRIATRCPLRSLVDIYLQDL